MDTYVMCGTSFKVIQALGVYAAYRHSVSMYVVL